jgi:hypothetical protein
MSELSRPQEDESSQREPANPQPRESVLAQRSPLDELAIYLDGECKETEARVHQLRDSVKGSCELLLKARHPRRRYWPYSCRPDSSGSLRPEYPKTAKARNISISTQAMCCSSVDEILKVSEIGHVLTHGQCSELRRCVTLVCRTILKTIRQNKGSKVKKLWLSGTFGPEDVFTASWVIKLVDQWKFWPEEQQRQFNWPNSVKKLLVSAVRRSAIEKGEIDLDRTLFKKGENEAGAHSLPLLKLVESARIIAKSEELSKYWLRSKNSSPQVVLERAGRWLERNLHRQMSFYKFKDFRFDAAELIFCLRGAILTEAVRKNEAIIPDVLTIIREAQLRSVYWRPYRPMLSTSQGMVLLPLSIEVATALLETLIQTDQFSSFKDTLDKYFQWLLNQKIESDRKAVHSSRWIGWHSENSYEAPVIHIWDTALVCKFLVDYWMSIEKEVQTQILRISSFSAKTPQTIAKGIEDLVAFDLECDPNTLASLNREFVDNHRDGKRQYSALLYGPPGVAKTTIVEGLAKSRNETLIYLSPSDFITRGEAGIEQQAKTIFRALEKLRGYVIFFDEIDRMILDRDSVAYGDQSDLFQFMTPGMLTKLNELRRVQRSIFIIATNYIERIDRAIRRPGRIDRSYICLPYDWKARTEILKSLVDDRWQGKKADLLTPWVLKTKNVLHKFAAGIPLYTYPELKGLFQNISGVKLANVQAFRAQVVNQVVLMPTEQAQNTLDSYTRRTLFPEGEAGKFRQRPFEEHACLLLLNGEVAKSTDKKNLKEAFGKLRSEWEKTMRGDFSSKWVEITKRANTYKLSDWVA